MVAIHGPWGRSTSELAHAVPRGMAWAVATAAMAEVGYVVGRVVTDIRRIEADRREDPS